MVKDFEESTLFKVTSEQENQSLAAHIKEESKKGNPRPKGHGKFQNKKGNRKSNAKKDDVCFTCNKKGHYAFDCYSNKNKKKCNNCKNIGHTEEECRFPKKAIPLITQTSQTMETSLLW